jgi:Gpi18-like mannosyltransferase
MTEWMARNRILLPWVGLLLAVYAAVALWLPDAGYDKYFWVTWTRYLMQHGLAHVYEDPEVNNNPLVMWLLWLFGLLFDTPTDVTYGTINRLKLLVVPFDLVALFFLGRKLMKTGRNIWLGLIVLLNPAFWYDTLIWGQIDGIYTCLIMVALVAAERGRWDLAWLMTLLSINLKLQAIIFLPIMILMTIRPMRMSGFNARWRIWSGLAGVQALILAPFILSGTLHTVLGAMLHRTMGYYPVLSRNAYNIYYLMARDPFNTPDTNVALGIPVRWWGGALFVVATALVTMPLFLALFNRAFNNLRREERLATLFQTAALTSLAFFLFNTQMHERYMHPAILFSGVYALMTRQWWPYALISLGYILNLEGVMHFLDWVDIPFVDGKIVHEQLLVFHPKVVAAILCACFIAGASSFYRTFMAFRNNVDAEPHTT